MLIYKIFDKSVPNLLDFVGCIGRRMKLLFVGPVAIFQILIGVFLDVT